MAATSLSPISASIIKSKTHSSLAISVTSIPKNATFHFSKWNPQLGISKFSTWNGLRNHGLPTSWYIVKIERKTKCRGKGVFASLFGVGAPEVLVIGVVALLVFGPKGLAEVARNLGNTLRAFQPTIRELQEVSREFKNTLEREIGLDEVQETLKSTVDSSETVVSADFKDLEPTDDSAVSNTPKTTEEYLKIFLAQRKEQNLLEQIKTASDETLVEPEGQKEDGSPSLTKEISEASAAQQQKETASAETSPESEGQIQVPDGAPSSTKVDPLQEYLEGLEKEWAASNSEKHKKMSSTETEVKSQDGSPSSSTASSTEEDVKTIEDQLAVSLVLHQKETESAETARAESVVELEGQDSQDVAPSSTKVDSDSLQEYLKQLEKDWAALNSEKQKKMESAAATEVKSKDTQEATSESPLSQNLESEDKMSEDKRIVQQLL